MDLNRYCASRELRYSIYVSCARTVASNIALMSAQDSGQAINHAYVCIVAAPVLTNKYTFYSRPFLCRSHSPRVSLNLHFFLIWICESKIN